MKKKVTWLAAIAVIITVVRMLYKSYKAKWDAIHDKDQIMRYNKVLSEWVKNEITSKSLEKYFTRRKLNRIAVYGVGEFGGIFYGAIKNTELEIAYFIDKAMGGNGAEIDGIPIYNLSNVEKMTSVDAIVITSVFYGEEIKQDLASVEVPAKKILSLEKIIEGYSAFNLSASVLGAQPQKNK